MNLLFSLICLHVVNRRMFAIKCVAENSVECIFVKQMLEKKKQQNNLILIYYYSI